MELSSVMGLMLMTHRRIRQEIELDKPDVLWKLVQRFFNGELEFLDIVVSYSYSTSLFGIMPHGELLFERKCPDNGWSLQVTETRETRWNLLHLHTLPEATILKTFRADVLEGEDAFRRDLPTLLMAMP